mmetsp:Transcript_28781/g.57974  ORF Transcript_28781/g.57974 Transcript_28781/m.57974 type:complete len:485 (+) Transcript_28781:185-1639(+)|eukprot:CAMPEP_0196748936 /NCGR_PEP_ID=MMETSP1091-20130531/75101_1 /TAXON_ID=302021 /ORGANISM="Rhodomonas sp., Strain CCMP768" /LENGTH=484 /DNA_ID=CAMNT_0042096329 /DNA_START=179 /DNA_END=1633 /DNA_ORIENTATION=-
MQSYSRSRLAFRVSDEKKVGAHTLFNLVQQDLSPEDRQSNEGNHKAEQHKHKTTLQQVVAQAQAARTAIDEDRIWFWMLQIASELRELHSSNIEYCSLKTSTVFLDSQDVISIAWEEDDFESSDAISPPESSDHGVLAGAQQNCDMWALGCVLYELMTLDVFSGQGFTPATYKGVECVAPVDAEGYSWDLRVAAGILLQQDPEHRPDAHSFVRFCNCTSPKKVIKDPDNNPLLRDGPDGETEGQSKGEGEDGRGLRCIVVVGADHIEDDARVLSPNNMVAMGSLTELAPRFLEGEHLPAVQTRTKLKAVELWSFCRMCKKRGKEMKTLGLEIRNQAREHSRQVHTKEEAADFAALEYIVRTEFCRFTDFVARFRLRQLPTYEDIALYSTLAASGELTPTAPSPATMLTPWLHFNVEPGDAEEACELMQFVVAGEARVTFGALRVRRELAMWFGILPPAKKRMLPQRGKAGLLHRCARMLSGKSP